jgi:hypothetical protein
MAQQLDFSGMTDAEITTMIANVQTHINRILTGAQSGAVGSGGGGQSFAMAKLSELTDLMSKLSTEQRLRALDGGDFILGSFGEPQAAE